MKTMKLFVLAAFLLIGSVAYTQTDYPYIPDRPGYAANAYLVGLHQLDFEASIGYCAYNVDDALTSTFYETTAFRYGAFKFLEFRAGVDVAGVYYPDNTSVGGVRSVYVGAKTPVIRDIKFLPDIAFLVSATLPYTGNPALTPTQYVPSAAILLQKSFGAVTIIGNAGVMWDAFTVDGYSFCNPNSVDRKAQGTYALAAYVFPTDNVGLFVETYGYYSESTKPYAGIDFGITASILPNFEFDVSTGLNYELGLDNSFINVGFGWLIPNKNK